MCAKNRPAFVVAALMKAPSVRDAVLVRGGRGVREGGVTPFSCQAEVHSASRALAALPATPGLAAVLKATAEAPRTLCAAVAAAPAAAAAAPPKPPRAGGKAKRQ